MNIFVGCSSKVSQNGFYNAIAEEVSEFIAKGKHNLVFGGQTTGLMGRIYESVRDSKQSKIFVVIHRSTQNTLGTFQFDQAHIAEDIGEKKSKVTELADVLVFIPGGLGTIDELISSIERKAQGEHSKPILIMNVNNYFGNLLKMLNKTYDEGFSANPEGKLYYVAHTLGEALSFLSALEAGFNSYV